jgi:superfamily II DNA/RNA helicase
LERRLRRSQVFFYLAEKIRTLRGRPEEVVIIHGGLRREERRQAVEAFLQDPNVLFLVANDAAGEGVNLQRAHFMVNFNCSGLCMPLIPRSERRKRGEQA